MSMSNTMNSENSQSESVPQAIRFQDAQAMYNQRRIQTKKDAAVIAEMKESTFRHRMAGRRSHEDYSITQRRLTAEEESIVLWRCDTLQRAGWLQTPKDARILALEILQKRDPDGKIGEDWVRKSLYKRHPEIKARWSQQLDRIRALRGSKGDYLAIKHFFDNVCIQVPLASQLHHETQTQTDGVIFFKAYGLDDRA